MWGSTCGDGRQRVRVRAQRLLSGSLPARSRLSSRPGQRSLAVRLPAIRRHSARDCHVSTGASAQLKRKVSDFADPLRGAPGGRQSQECGARPAAMAVNGSGSGPSACSVAHCLQGHGSPPGQVSAAWRFGYQRYADTRRGTAMSLQEHPRSSNAWLATLPTPWVMAAAGEAACSIAEHSLRSQVLIEVATMFAGTGHANWAEQVALNIPASFRHAEALAAIAVAAAAAGHQAEAERIAQAISIPVLRL